MNHWTTVSNARLLWPRWIRKHPLSKPGSKLETTPQTGSPLLSTVGSTTTISPPTNRLPTKLEPLLWNHGRFVPNHLPQWHYHHTTSAPGVAWLIAILFRPQKPKGI